MSAMSSGIYSLPPAAFSCPPPWKYIFAQLFADVPFLERIDILTKPLSSFAKTLKIGRAHV